MLKGSEDIIESAKVHSSLADAVSEYHYTFATSHRVRQGEAIDIQTAATEIAKLSRKNRVALIFGSEKFGLSQKDVTKADRIVYLPSSQSFPSINLASAVTMLALQVKLELTSIDEGKPKDNLDLDIKNLSKGETERLYEEFSSLFEIAGMENSSIIEKIRTIFDRANLTEREKNLFLGLIKELKKFATEDGESS